tara:strand:- start:15567 stop:16478 length:912 start_codon:yes stop_codon:yes gene_type:complete
MHTQITIKSPATTANLGPGFDCMAMALDLWNETTFKLIEKKQNIIEVTGQGSENLSKNSENLILKSFNIPFTKAKISPPYVKITCKNNIPIGKGLGSSSAAIISGLIAGNELSAKKLTKNDLLLIANNLEGHPDNASATIFGGCQIVIKDQDKLISSSIPLSNELSTILFIPDINTVTKSSRKKLPDQIPLEDAVYNIGRTGLLIKSLMSNDYNNLNLATQDKLHQQYRLIENPRINNILKAATSYGALGAFLSGSGPTVLALAKNKEFTIGYEMAEAAAKSGIKGYIKITKPAKKGTHIIKK